MRRVGENRSAGPTQSRGLCHTLTAHFSGISDVILGECKDRGKDPADPRHVDTITQSDVDRIRKVADGFLKKRFNVYILFSKLAPFTPNEVAAAKTLNSLQQPRVILLTPEELEPYHFYDRLISSLKQFAHGGTARQIASTTEMIYFPVESRRQPAIAPPVEPPALVAVLPQNEPP